MSKSKIKARHRKSQASQADKYTLYQESVQEPECEIKFFNRVFRKEFGRTPLILREDFCGTAAVCCEWVKNKPKCTAVGVDFDPEPLEWGCRNNMSKLKPANQRQIKFIQDDVRKVQGPKADVLVAQNFSFFIFKTRDELRDYFKIARQNIAKQGVMVLDMMGGSEVQLEDHEDETEKEGFTYIWEQVRFDPITHDCKFHIHFHFDDGSKMNRAFTYDWRLWSIPEVCELLIEAGFKRTDVYWEGTDGDGDGDGIFRVRKNAEADPAWVTYIAAVK